MQFHRFSLIFGQCQIWSSTVSKLIEKSVYVQLNDYRTVNYFIRALTVRIQGFLWHKDCTCYCHEWCYVITGQGRQCLPSVIRLVSCIWYGEPFPPTFPFKKFLWQWHYWVCASVAVSIVPCWPTPVCRYYRKCPLHNERSLCEDSTRLCSGSYIIPIIYFTTRWDHKTLRSWLSSLCWRFLALCFF